MADIHCPDLLAACLARPPTNSGSPGGSRQPPGLHGGRETPVTEGSLFGTPTVFSCRAAFFALPGPRPFRRSDHRLTYPACYPTAAPMIARIHLAYYCATPTDLRFACCR